MTYRFGIFGSFGGESGIKLVEEIISRTKDGSIAADLLFILSSRAADEDGNAHRLTELVDPETTTIITHSARRFMPQLFKADRARWRTLYHHEIINLISDYSFDSILLVGYMFFTSDELCQRYNLLNLHPAPPGGPKGSWQEVIRQLIESEAESAGAQIHLATPEWDAGPTLSYATIPIKGGEFAPLWEEVRERLAEGPSAKINRDQYTTSRLAARLTAVIRQAEAALELPLLIETLRLLARGDLRIEGTGESARFIAFGEEMPGGYSLTEKINSSAGSGEKDPPQTAQISGSVKQIIVDRPASQHAPGTGLFRFSDCYSVFDWGAMPDRLPDKGKVLALMSAYNFELLERAGIATHYRGLVVKRRIVRYADAADLPAQPAAEMAIAVVAKPPLHCSDGRYGYHRYLREAGKNYLVPLEVVYRSSVPPGSSLRRRRTPADLGLEMREWPHQEIALPEPMVEFFTKLEGSDRFVEDEEALLISGLSGPLFLRMTEITLEVGRILAAQAEKGGLSIADGKLEFICCNGRLLVCDVIGTPDENRFQLDGLPANKEVLRRYHLENDLLWVEEVMRIKRSTGGVTGWQKRCARAPAALPSKFRDLCAETYCALANSYLGREWFAARDLDGLLHEISKFRGEETA